MKTTKKMLKHAKIANDISSRDLGVHLTKPGIALRFYVIEALGFTPPPRKYFYKQSVRKSKYAPIGTYNNGKLEQKILMKDYGEEIITWAEALKHEYSSVHASYISIRRGFCMDKENSPSEVRIGQSHINFTIGNFTPLDLYFTETEFVYCSFFDRKAKPKLRVWKVPGSAMKKAMEQKLAKVAGHSGGGGRVASRFVPGKPSTSEESIQLSFSERQIYRICCDLKNDPYHEQDLDF